MIDVLSKYAVVVPIKSKTPPDVMAGTMEGLQKMRAKPKVIYTDDERAIASADFTEYIEGGAPAFAGRFIISFKDKLFKRVDNDEKKESNTSNGLAIYLK